MNEYVLEEKKQQSESNWLAFAFVQTLWISKIYAFNGKVWILKFEHVRVSLEEALHGRAFDRWACNDGYAETGSGNQSTTSESIKVVNPQL